MTLLTTTTTLAAALNSEPTGQQTRRPAHRSTPSAVSMAASLSHAFQGYGSAGRTALTNSWKLLFVLIRLALGEVGDRPVERVVATGVLGDGDRIP